MSFGDIIRITWVFFSRRKINKLGEIVQIMSIVVKWKDTDKEKGDN